MKDVFPQILIFFAFAAQLLPAAGLCAEHRHQNTGQFHVHFLNEHQHGHHHNTLPEQNSSEEAENGQAVYIVSPEVNAVLTLSLSCMDWVVLSFIVSFIVRQTEPPVQSFKDRTSDTFLPATLPVYLVHQTLLI